MSSTATETCVGCGAVAPAHPWRGRAVGHADVPVCDRCHRRPRPGMKYHYFARGAPTTSGPSIAVGPAPEGPLNTIRFEGSAYLHRDRDDAGVLHALQRACGSVLDDDAGITLERRVTRGAEARFAWSKAYRVPDVPPTWGDAVTPEMARALVRTDPLHGRGEDLRLALEAELQVVLLGSSLLDRVEVLAFPAYVKES